MLLLIIRSIFRSKVNQRTPMLKNTLLFAPLEHREVMLKPKVYSFICLHINDMFVYTSFLRYPKIVSTVSIRQTDTSRTVPMRILKWRNVITEIEQIIYRNRIDYLEKQNRSLIIQMNMQIVRRYGSQVFSPIKCQKQIYSMFYRVSV